jgi:hypothetical protein
MHRPPGRSVPHFVYAKKAHQTALRETAECALIGRVKRRVCESGAAIVLLVLATIASAQTLPLPALPKEPAPAPTPPPQKPQMPTGKAESKTSKDPALVPPSESPEPPTLPRPRPWDYAVAAGARWDSNINFLVPNGPEGLAMVPSGVVARNFWNPRGLLRTLVSGRADGYPASGKSDLNRYYTTFKLDGNYLASSIDSLSASGEYIYGYSDDNSIILQQGVPLPLVKTRSIEGHLVWSHETGRQTTLKVGSRYYRTEFELPILQTGESLRATVELERALNFSNRTSVVYSFENVLSDTSGHTYETHFGSLRWSHLFSARAGVLVEAGASYTPDAELAGLGRSESFFGGVTFARHVGRSTASAFVRREVTPAFGLGVSLLETRMGLSLDAPMGRDWRLLMFGFHMEPDSQQVPAYTDGLLTLSRLFSERYAVSLESRYRRHGATDRGQGLDSLQVGVFWTVGPLGSVREPTLIPPYR